MKTNFQAPSKDDVMTLLLRCKLCATRIVLSKPLLAYSTGIQQPCWVNAGREWDRENGNDDDSNSNNNNKTALFETARILRKVLER